MAITIAGPRLLNPSGPHSEWWRRELQLLAALQEVCARVHFLTHDPDSIPALDIREAPWRAREVIAVVSKRCAEELGRHCSTERPLADALSMAMLDLQKLAMDFYLYEHAMRSERLAECVNALGRLRSITSPEVLLDRSCTEVVLGCGFHRAVLSRVQAWNWRPERLYDRAANPPVGWFADWKGQAVRLHSGLPERELCSSKRPLMVFDTSLAPVHQPLIVESGRCQSYVVAPIVSSGEVIAFLHVDHSPMPRRVDRADHEVAWVFAHGVGQLYDRIDLMNQIANQRNRVRDLLLRAIDDIDDLCDVRVGPQPPEVLSDRNARIDRDRFPDLSEREVEVASMMAAGASNGDIAQALIIAEGTVKSHVRRVLRKVGARNRAELVALTA